MALNAANYRGALSSRHAYSTLRMGRIVELTEGDAPLAGVELDGCEMADLVAEAAGARRRGSSPGGKHVAVDPDGDAATVEPLAARLGDVAAFRLPGAGRRLRVHRLVRRTVGGWLARGDRLAGTDGVIPEADTRVVRHIERNGRVRFLPRGAAAVWLAAAPAAGSAGPGEIGLRTGL